MTITGWVRMLSRGRPRTVDHGAVSALAFLRRKPGVREEEMVDIQFASSRPDADKQRLSIKVSLSEWRALRRSVDTTIARSTDPEVGEEVLEIGRSHPLYVVAVTDDGAVEMAWQRGGAIAVCAKREDFRIFFQRVRPLP